jgi:histidinol phosphatase-like enzyme
MIGDAWSDVQAGLTAGVRQAILLETGRGKEQLSQARPENIPNHLIFGNLAMAVETIFTIDNIQATEPQD